MASIKDTKTCGCNELLDELSEIKKWILLLASSGSQPHSVPKHGKTLDRRLVRKVDIAYPY